MRQRLGMWGGMVTVSVLSDSGLLVIVGVRGLGRPRRRRGRRGRGRPPRPVGRRHVGRPRHVDLGGVEGHRRCRLPLGGVGGSAGGGDVDDVARNRLAGSVCFAVPATRWVCREANRRTFCPIAWNVGGRYSQEVSVKTNASLKVA